LYKKKIISINFKKIVDCF